MVRQDLVDYVRGAIEKGYSISSIKKTLLNKGWPETDVNDAVNAAVGAEEPVKKSSKAILIIIIAFLLVVGGIAAFLIFKAPKGKAPIEYDIGTLTAEGTTQTATQNEIIKFAVNGAEYAAVVTKIIANGAEISLLGRSLTFEIWEANEVTLKEGKIKLTLNGIAAGKASLTFKIIEEVITPIAYCGDGNCTGNETSANCCVDCGCPIGQECADNICVEKEECVDYACCSDSDCDDADAITTDSCINPSTKNAICQNVPIAQDECQTNADCDDADPCTVEICLGTPKNCSHEPITECVSADGCCPSGCGYEEDNDCELTDPIKIECGGNIWCYHDRVVETNNYELCFNINNYWDDVDQGVIGSCIESIARNTANCSLCEYIVKQDIHNICIRDVCGG